ncbi:MAG: hypothetical protein AB7O67_06475 [Vicinamibacterales bacterium]
MRNRGTFVPIFVLAFVTGIATLAAAGLTYTAPAGWQQGTPTSAMRLAQFTLPGKAGDAELVIYYFGGSGGSVDANIARWIGQMQQPDGSSSDAVAKRSTRTINGLQATLVDVSGTYVAEVMPGAATRHHEPGYRLRAVVITTPQGPYFIKLTGPAATVAAQDAAIERFLASIAYE